MHFRIPPSLFVRVETCCGAQGGIDDRTVPHDHVLSTELFPGGLNDLQSQLELLEQVAAGVNTRLIWEQDIYQHDLFTSFIST